jgi:hypothetical protein
VPGLSRAEGSAQPVARQREEPDEKILDEEIEYIHQIAWIKSGVHKGGSMTYSSFVKNVISLASVAIALGTAGCSIPISVYSPAGKNVQAIRSVPATVEVGQISGNETTVSCRLQPIGPENGETFASYIAKAINEEIIMAGGAQRGPKVTISGTLKTIDVDCGILSGSWIIKMDVSINNQPPFPVNTVYQFDGNYFGYVVLERAHTAFIPMIQDLVNNIISSPSFQAAVRRQ